jgi:hypothetical protein
VCGVVFCDENNFKCNVDNILILYKATHTNINDILRKSALGQNKIFGL